ncbi:hypothetical protein BKA70DRAFT_1314907 [Coprinopsis sp. MPI-PUGE-AT-0042]|nr:hypothetical protein BKA70DRAFT_1314907 [Coprinopsis sp. MPI-PUGE-AT-0042]
MPQGLLRIIFAALLLSSAFALPKRTSPSNDQIVLDAEDDFAPRSGCKKMEGGLTMCWERIAPQSHQRSKCKPSPANDLAGEGTMRQD